MQLQMFIGEFRKGGKGALMASLMAILGNGLLWIVKKIRLSFKTVILSVIALNLFKIRCLTAELTCVSAHREQIFRKFFTR
jgi:hypothetical protein